jgi:hypothetical protein
MKNLIPLFFVLFIFSIIPAQENINQSREKKIENNLLIRPDSVETNALRMVFEKYQESKIEDGSNLPEPSKRFVGVQNKTKGGENVDSVEIEAKGKPDKDKKDKEIKDDSKTEENGPSKRPPGWDKGKKTGWQGGDTPPGLRKAKKNK